MLDRVVANLTRLIAHSDVVSETSGEYNALDGYEYRDDEYEYVEDKEPEQMYRRKHYVCPDQRYSVTSDNRSSP